MRTARLAGRGLAAIRWSDATLGKIAVGLIALLAGSLVGDLTLAQLAGMVALLVALGSFGYTLNDWFDRREDALSGRPSTVGRLPAPVAWALISALLALVVALSRLYAERPAVLALVAGQVAAGVAYSSPPLRLKTRGGWGLLAILAAQYILPGALLMACLPSSRSTDWVFCLGFALANGLSLEVGHQIADKERDEATALGTFAVRWPEPAVRSIHRRALAVLGLAIVACPFYLCARLAGTVRAQGLWLAAWAPLLVVALRLGVDAGREWRATPGADPFYGPSGPAIQRLYSYFPNCLLPGWLALLVVVHDPKQWPLLVAAALWLRGLAAGRGTFSTGTPHYGFRWHLREAAAIVWPRASHPS